MGLHVNHVALRVPDLDASADHARRTLGLTETRRTATEALLTSNERHHELQLISDSEAAFDHLGLEADSREEWETLCERVRASHAEILSERAQEAGVGDAIRLRVPGGIVVELLTGMQRHPPTLSQRLGGHARKLGHATFVLSGESTETVRFLVDVLGLRVSDTDGPLTWLRCDADHHGIAVGGGFPGPDRLHHYAFELRDWSGMLDYVDDLAVDGQTLLWGPGRHGPGNNLFTYLVDPAGCVLEAYADLQRIDDDAAYVPLDWSTVASALNLWGPGMPADYGDFGAPLPSAGG